MTRFASAPWPLKAAYVGTLAVAVVGLLGAVATTLKKVIAVKNVPAANRL